MKLLVITITLLFNYTVYGQSVYDIRKKLGIKTKEDVEERDVVKGFKQVAGKHYIVQVKDISLEEAGHVLRHMDRLMEEFMKLYEYPFGTQKCYITIYGLKKDFDRLARLEDLENAGAFSYRKGINHFAVTYYSDDLYRTLNHEAFHLFIENIFRKGVPIWFNEGMASYYETCTFIGDRFVTNKVNKDRLILAKESLHTKQWPRFKDLVRFSWDEFHGDNEIVNYSASWTLIYYLRNKDEVAFKNFVNDLVLGKSFSTSIRSNYDMDRKELENEWIKYIEGLQ